MLYPHFVVNVILNVYVIHCAGVKAKARYYCVNILEELDVPTEVSTCL